MSGHFESLDPLIIIEVIVGLQLLSLEVRLVETHSSKLPVSCLHCCLRVRLVWIEPKLFTTRS